MGKHAFHEFYYSAKEMISKYRKFAENVFESGYDDFMEEYDNDLFVRLHIEQVLNGESQLPSEEFNSFKTEVFKVDEILKKAFVDGKERSGYEYWWEKGILKKGSGDYANDIKEMYGIDITG